MRYSPIRLTLTVAAALCLLALPVFAQPADSVLKDFRPYGDYSLVVDGKEVPTGEIYFADRIPAFLILTSRLPSPVLVSVKSQTAQTVNLLKVSRQKDGSIDLLADAALASQGAITVNADNSFTFAADKHQVALRNKPPLLGLHGAADLKAYSPPIYVEGGKYYQPDHQVIAGLKRSGPATLRVFFGSWCPHCQHTVPQILRVEDELKGSKIKFEYFGLPREGMSKDPEAKKYNVNGVPTGIVFINGKEAGRLSGSSWVSPETALATVVSAAAAAKGK